MIVLYLITIVLNFCYFFLSKNRARYLNLVIAVILLLMLL